MYQSSSVSGPPEERVVYLETTLMTEDAVELSKNASGVTLLVVGRMKSTEERNETTTTVTSSSSRMSGLRECLSGMRVGGRRRVLIPTTKNPAVSIRFVGPGATAINDENDDAIVMTLTLEALEPPSSWKAMVAKTITSGGIPAAALLLVRPFLSPIGLVTLFCFVPLIVKKTINGFAAMELYLDVDADAVYPIQELLKWKLKF